MLYYLKQVFTSRSLLHSGKLNKCRSVKMGWEMSECIILRKLWIVCSLPISTNPNYKAFSAIFCNDIIIYIYVIVALQTLTYLCYDEFMSNSNKSECCGDGCTAVHKLQPWLNLKEIQGYFFIPDISSHRQVTSIFGKVESCGFTWYLLHLAAINTSRATQLRPGDVNLDGKCDRRAPRVNYFLHPFLFAKS